MKRKTVRMVSIVIALMAIMVSGLGAVDGKTATKNGPITLKVWSRMDSTVSKYCSSYNDILAFQEMEKATGVKTQFIHPMGDPTEAFNLMIATRDYPDVINYYWGINEAVPGGTARYAKDGVIVPLNKYLKYAPNFSKLLAQNKAIKKALADDTGNIYYFPIINTELTTRTYNGFMIRQDWLDAAGLAMPKTTEELYKVLKTWQDKDVNGNGKKDECWTATKFGNGTFDLSTLLWPFGASAGNQSLTQHKGKIVYGPLRPGFKEGIKYLARLYREGLIDPDYLLNDVTRWEQKSIAEYAGGSYGIASRLLKFNNEIGKKNKNVEWVPLPSLKGPNGTSAWYEVNSAAIVNGGIALAITTANKHIPETVKWMDWVYSKEGISAFNYGKEGVTYTVVNGKPRFTDAITKDPKGRTQNDMLRITAPGIAIWPTLSDLDGTMLQKTPTEWNAFQVWGKNMPDNSGILPTLQFTDSEQQVLKDKKVEIDAYVAEMFDKFVIGKEPVENYDKVFVPKLKALGINEVIKVYQSALDRYNKRR